MKIKINSIIANEKFESKFAKYEVFYKLERRKNLIEKRARREKLIVNLCSQEKIERKNLIVKSDYQSKSTWQKRVIRLIKCLFQKSLAAQNIDKKIHNSLFSIEIHTH